jgi:hypothetical protein
VLLFWKRCIWQKGDGRHICSACLLSGEKVEDCIEVREERNAEEEAFYSRGLGYEKNGSESV